MSLLIKALETAEKDKKDEKAKAQTGEYVVDDVLSLAMPPVKTSVDDELAKFEAEASHQKYEEDFDFVLSSNDFASDGLTLEEEAGLTPTTLPVGHYAKSKLNLDLASTAKLANKPINNTDQAVSANTSSQSVTAQAAEVKQNAAAKVFVANQSAKAPTSKSALALLGVVGALMVWLGLQGYTYIKSATTPNVVVVKPALPTPKVVADAVPLAVPQDAPIEAGQDVAGNHNQDQNSPTTNNQLSSGSAAQASASPSLSPSPRPRPSLSVDNGSAADKKELVINERTAEPVSEASAASAFPERTLTKQMQAKKIKDNTVMSNSAVSPKRPLRLVSKLPLSGVDPTLLAAYQAFTRGEDASAQQQYRQVLQQDVRNIDALLGMAAIAQRQGRTADAVGWYQKVLEIEPRNSIAQTAVASQQNGADAVGTESRIKSMIAQQPDAAHLHAALGNLYAEQNQWASAQEAYFNASRYAPNNADYAFNMAISLDQLGKSNLALNQYQRALELLNKSGASSPDKATLEARIHALQ
jgi:tetratricopeptide (TPR) repeat protein